MTLFPSAAVRRHAAVGPSRVIAALESRWTLRVAIAAFVLVGAVLSVVVHMPIVDGAGHVPYAGTVAPDENRHIANVLYYASRSVWAGPIITDAPPQLLTMGEIERFPSYFYYYVASFPVKVLVHFGAPYNVVVVALRFANVLIAAVGVAVVHRLVRALGMSASVATLVAVLLVATGRYEWQAAAVTYDTPANTLYFVCLLYCARLVRAGTESYRLVFLAVLSGAVAVILKYTFVPFVLVAVVVAVVLAVQRGGVGTFAHPLRRLGGAFRDRPVSSSAWAALTVGAVAVLVERVGVNLLVYGQFNPACTKLHGHQQCLAFDIYRRNYWAGRSHDISVLTNTHQSPFDPLEFVGRWLSAYFQSMYFYRGRTTTSWQVDIWVQVVGAAVFVLALVATILALRLLLRNRSFLWGIVVAGSYVVATFFFNLRTFLRLDNEYAFAGRYLIPVLPLIYAFALVSAIAMWRALPTGWRRVLVVPVVLVGLFVAVTYAGPVAFFQYADDPSWYTPIGLRILPHVITGGAS